MATVATDKPDIGPMPDLEVVGFHEYLPTPQDVADARHFARDILDARGAGPEMIAAAELVVDEFALNALRHAGSFFSVVIEHGPGVVKIAVRDDSDVLPQIREHVLTSITGRGLSIVASAAQEWGADSLGHGKEVWALLREE